MGGAHFAALRGRLLLVLPHAAGTHSSDGLTYNVRDAGQSQGKIYAVNKDHLESPDDDTPRPRVQDDGLLGPRLRWKLFPPPLTLFTAPVLLGWRHLPQADSFFWRKDVEDSALARYSVGGSAGAHSGEMADDATQSPESFEEVLIEEPEIEQRKELEAASVVPEAEMPLTEEEMPMYIQAGDVRLSSHDYHDDDFPTRPATTTRHRSRSRRRSSVKQQAAKDVATPAAPASSSSSSLGAFPPEPPMPEPSVASTAPDAAVKRATAKPSAWTIPQWARKAINKRLKERRAQMPSGEPPPRPRGKSIWFTSEDEAEDAGQVQQRRSSHVPRVEDPAMPDAARSSRDAYMSAVCQPLFAWVSSYLCLPAPPVPMLSPRFGEMRLGLCWSAAVAHSALVSCVFLMSIFLDACTHGTGQLGIELPNWLLDDMPTFWLKGPSSWSGSAASGLAQLSRLRPIQDQPNIWLTRHLPRTSAMRTVRLPLETACTRPVPQRAALLSLRLDLSLPLRSRPPPLLCVRGQLRLKQAPIRFFLIIRRPVYLLSSSTSTLWTDVPRVYASCAVLSSPPSLHWLRVCLQFCRLEHGLYFTCRTVPQAYPCVLLLWGRIGPGRLSSTRTPMATRKRPAAATTSCARSRKRPAEDTTSASLSKRPTKTSGVTDTVEGQQQHAVADVAPPNLDLQTAEAGTGGPGSGSRDGLEGLEDIYPSGAEEGSDDDVDSFHREVAELPPPGHRGRTVAARDEAPRGGNTRRGISASASPPSAHRRTAIRTDYADTIPPPTSLYPPTLSWADLGSENFHAFCDLPMGLVLRAAATHLFSTGR